MPPGQPLARTQKLGQQQQQPQQQRQQQQQQQQQQRQQQQQQQQQEALGEPGGPGLGGQLDQHPGPTPGHGPTPAPTAAVTLDEETQQRIERSRMKIRFRKFWDLMHERDRPWHYDAVLHLCSRLPPYSCGRYAAVTAGTMQRILARRAKAERVVREQRELARALRRRMAAASLQMSRTGQPISDEWLAQLRRLATQLATGGGNAAAALRQLQGAAWSPYRDQDYIDYVEQLLPLLEETEEVGHVAKHQLLPALQRLRAETARLQATMSARALARDQVLAALASLYERRREPGSAVDPDAWPQLTADEAVEWRYPPMAYWGRPEELRWRLPEQLDGELEQMQGVGQQPWPGPEQGLGGGGAGHGWSGRWSAVSADQGAGEEEERWEEARWEDLTWEEAQREAGGQGPGGWRDVRPTSGSSAWISTGAGGALPGLFD
ncbi:hypothetical protein HYH02_001480 [Chlamydomonas schloesseri]|uniref:Uncharacterized protein n=1 Tax=Chlamydomonas schloesseri TaxID=2026947 RepID=A0A836BCI4_9CHLO|nr:hypothetical protein HYH02_001480 [Chlamydomonas schloesseri]|eukprot:KAG2454461.1 hypothetical protein HYH02_001480 [Chlamydomonas schloesseri]